MDETDNYQMCIGMHPKIMWFHILLARNKIFPFLHWWQSPCSHVNPTNNDSVLSSYLGFWKFKAMPDDVLDNYCVKTWFNLTLTSAISSSIVVVDIDSCSVIITLFCWPHCLKGPWTQLPSHNWHNKVAIQIQYLTFTKNSDMLNKAPRVQRDVWC